MMTSLSCELIEPIASEDALCNSSIKTRIFVANVFIFNHWCFSQASKCVSMQLKHIHWSQPSHIDYVLFEPTMVMHGRCF